jgi:hypothetical protein
VRNAGQSKKPFAVAVYFLRAIDFRYLLLPVLLVFSLGYALEQDYYLPRRVVLEYIGLLTISYFLLVALLRFRYEKTKFHLGCVWIILAFASREIHFTGSAAVVYVSVLVLIYLMLTQFDFFKPYVDSKPYFSIFAAAFLAYFISVTIDQRWWRFVPYEDKIHTSLEETMEIIGHLLLGTALILWKRVAESNEQIELRQSTEE